MSARIHKQILRTMAIIEALQKGIADIGEIFEFVNQVIPEPVSTRTIRRDLDALETLGYCTCVRTAKERPQYTISWPTREIVIESQVSITHKDAKKQRFLELAADKTLTNAAISEELQISIETVVNWRNQFDKRKNKPYRRKSNAKVTESGAE